MFSIIITTHNRPCLLRQCLNSVVSQDFSKEDFEIIVVDDGSGKHTQCVLEEFSSMIRFVKQPQQGWGIARANGAKVSVGDILIFLDDDCIAPQGWLGTIAQVYSDLPQCDVVAGGLRLGQRTNVAGYRLYVGHREYFNRLNASSGTTADGEGRCKFSFGGNRSFRRKLWFDVQPNKQMWYGDDAIIDSRLQSQDAFMYYTSKAWVYHNYHLDLKQRIVSAYRYGYSIAHMKNIPVGIETKPRNRIRALSEDLERFSVAEVLWYVCTQPMPRLALYFGILVQLVTQARSYAKRIRHKNK